MSFKKFTVYFAQADYRRVELVIKLISETMWAFFFLPHMGSTTQ